MPNTDRGGFCGALQRTPPAIPAGLARRLANKENYGMGKVSAFVTGHMNMQYACKCIQISENENSCSHYQQLA